MWLDQKGIDQAPFRRLLNASELFTFSHLSPLLLNCLPLWLPRELVQKMAISIFSPFALRLAITPFALRLAIKSKAIKTSPHFSRAHSTSDRRFSRYMIFNHISFKLISLCLRYNFTTLFLLSIHFSMHWIKCQRILLRKPL